MARSYNKGGFKTSWSQKPLHTCTIPTDVRDKYSVETSDMFVNLTSPTTLIECILPTTLIEYWDGPTSPSVKQTAPNKAEITLEQSHRRKFWYQLKSTVAGHDLVD